MIETTKIDFNKSQGLVPAIVQDASTGKVLMLGYMNVDAVKKTIETKKVTFYSRSKNRLWMKGEESGNILHLKSIRNDCDSDALLIKADPVGPVCHKGSDTCWKEQNISNDYAFLGLLESVIDSRKSDIESESYTSSLFRKGINKIAQKVGEEAVELVIESKDNDKDLFLGEAADLVFHLLVLLKEKNTSLEEVIQVLKSRHKT